MKRSPIYRVCLLVAHAAIPLCVGCAHGDAIIIRDVRGRILDRTSGAPLASARVTARLQTDAPDHRRPENHTRTGSDGRFSVHVTIGGGTVTWVFFVPIVRGDLLAPRVERVTIVVENEDRSATLERSFDPRGQSMSCATKQIELGDLPVDLPAHYGPVE